jgi:hypothetical protein
MNIPENYFNEKLVLTRSFCIDWDEYFEEGENMKIRDVFSPREFNFSARDNGIMVRLNGVKVCSDFGENKKESFFPYRCFTPLSLLKGISAQTKEKYGSFPTLKDKGKIGYTQKARGVS